MILLACLLVPASASADPDDDELEKLAAQEVIEVHADAPAPASEESLALGKDELAALPGASDDALAAIRSLPGVAMSPAVAAGRLVIRGGAPQDSLLSIDGVPVPFAYHSFDNSTILPASMIGAMTYSPGGFGVEDGRATSGAVAILTANDEPQRPTAQAQLSLLDASAQGAVPLSIAHGVYLTGAVRRSTVDLLIPFAVPASLMIGFTTPPRYYDGQLQLDWIAGAHDHVKLLALTSFDQLGIVNHMADTDLPADFTQHSSFSRLIASWQHDGARVRNRLVGALGNDDFHARFDTIQHVDDTGTLALVRDDLAIDVARGVRVRTGAFAQAEGHALDARSILVSPDGLPPGHFNDLPIRTIDTTYDANYAAAYAAADVMPTARTTVTGGVRVERFGHIGATVVEPRVEVAQRIAELTLHAAVGRYARDLNQIEGIPTNLFPELATQVSAGSDLALGQGLTASATVYRTTREHLAVEDPTLAAMLPYASTGRGNSGGVDLLLRLRRDHFFGWIAYSFSKSNRLDAPTQAWHLTAFDQTHAFTTVGSYERGAWRFGGRFQYATGLPYTPVLGATYDAQLDHYLPVLGAPYSARYPDVAQLSLRAERVWHRRGLTIAAFLDINNLFRDARVERYTYSADFTQRHALDEYVPLPSVGIRGEL
jgi:hypothetical protein